MDVQQQQQQQPTSSSPPRRRRYQRWSRIRRTLSENNSSSANKSDEIGNLEGRLKDHEVRAETHICFAKDGSWFQGIISPPRHGVFKLCGVRRKTRSNSHRKPKSGKVSRRGSQVTTMTADQQLRVNSVDSGRSSCHGAETLQQRQSESPDQDQLSSSCSSSVDCDLLNSIMEKLEINNMGDDDDFVDEAIGDVEMEDDEYGEDDGSDLESGIGLFRVLVVDYDTGLDYKLDKVVVKRDGTLCSISSDQLSFRSERCFKGAAADTVLVRHLSPSFVDQGLKVFRGQVTFRYRDQLCRPVSVEETKWCL